MTQGNQINDQSSKKLLDTHLRQLGLTVPGSVQQKILDFLTFLTTWNQQFNLTAITDIDAMVTQHVLDSLAIVPFISGDFILDVGSGAGFPGVPLSLYYPKKQWYLLDSNGKKTRFLVQAKHTFVFSNIEIIQARAQTWSSPQLFDTIITRAVGSIPDIIKQTQHLLKPSGQWLFMKGVNPQNELEALSQPFKTYSLTVPGVIGERHLVVVPVSDEKFDQQFPLIFSR